MVSSETGISLSRMADFIRCIPGLIVLGEPDGESASSIIVMLLRRFDID